MVLAVLSDDIALHLVFFGVEGLRFSGENFDDIITYFLIISSWQKEDEIIAADVSDKGLLTYFTGTMVQYGCGAEQNLIASGKAINIIVCLEVVKIDIDGSEGDFAGRIIQELRFNHLVAGQVC